MAIYVKLNPTQSGLADITFSWINDRNVIRQLQPQTISSALEPGRSTYGTFQQIGYPSTVTKKYLWLFQEVFATAAQVDILEDIIEDNTVYTHTFTDFLYPVLRAGSESVSPYTATVRMLTNGEWLGPCSFSPTINAKVWPVTFTLIEV